MATPKQKCYILTVFERFSLKFAVNAEENIWYVFTKFHLKIFTDFNVMEFLISMTENVSWASLKSVKPRYLENRFECLNKIFRRCVAVVWHKIAKYELEILMHSKVIHFYSKNQHQHEKYVF